VNRSLIFLFILAAMFMPANAQETKSKPQSKVAVPEPYRELLHKAQQMLVVTTPGWDNVDGSMRLFEKHDGKWQPVGDAFPIVVGKSGLGWDGITEAASAAAERVKKEGDGRSPAGVFKISELFGFEPSMEAKLPYQPLTEYVECVDDKSSMSYNQIVDLKEVPHPDWNSSEKMRTIEQYQIGAVVDYNSPKVPGAGSCIFLHIWKGPGRGTAGCTAMNEAKVRELAGWLDAKKNPVLVQLPEPMYERVRASWELP
jgi:D-alanyl-D-alanine dipeptidase